MVSTDYYVLLGVPRNASQEEITGAYRKLARQYHPDVTVNDPAKMRQFQDIGEAYEVLKDAVKRGRYDQNEKDAGTVSDPRSFMRGHWTEIFRHAQTQSRERR